MPTHKADLTQLSLNQLSDLTGLTYRTLKKKLKGLDPADEDGRTLLFNSREALEIIYLGTPDERSMSKDPESEGGEQKKIDIRYESARNVKLRNDHLSHDLAVKRGEHVPLTEVSRIWSDKFVSFKSRLRLLPGQLAEKLLGIENAGKVEVIIQRALDSALEEMAKDGSEENLDPSDAGSAKEVASAAGSDDF